MVRLPYPITFSSNKSLIMIRIGINESIFIADAAFDATNYRLKITFEETGGTKYASMFARMNAAEAVENLPTRDITLFAPMKPDDEDAKGNKRTLEQKVKMVNSNLTATKAQLLHILYGYLPKAEAVLPMFDGLAIDENNYSTQIVKEEIFKGVFKNLATGFIAKIKPFLNKSEEQYLFRLLLVRQSPEKNFATLRSVNIIENPFWESMSVPKASSQLAFTPGEIKDGLDNDLPVSRSDADKKATSQPTGQQPPAQTAKDIFGA